MFLKQEKLDHFVYPVDIMSCTDSRGYSENDLSSVARALRDIRQSEDMYKEKALSLLEKFRLENDKYSWEAVANNFIDSVLNQFNTQLKNETTVFYRLEDLTKININSCENFGYNIAFNPSVRNHFFRQRKEFSYIP